MQWLVFTLKEYVKWYRKGYRRRREALNKKRRVCVHCASGKRATLAVASLASEGIEAVDWDFSEWEIRVSEKWERKAPSPSSSFIFVYQAVLLAPRILPLPDPLRDHEGSERQQNQPIRHLQLLDRFRRQPIHH